MATDGPSSRLIRQSLVFLSVNGWCGSRGTLGSSLGGCPHRESNQLGCRVDSKCLSTDFGGRTSQTGCSTPSATRSSSTTRTSTAQKRYGPSTARVPRTTSSRKHGQYFEMCGCFGTATREPLSSTLYARAEAMKGESPIAGLRWSIFADCGTRRTSEMSSAWHSSHTERRDMRMLIVLVRPAQGTKTAAAPHQPTEVP